MSKWLSRFSFLLLTGLIQAVSPTLLAEQSDLDVSIRPVEHGVEFVLTNTSATDLSLLRWETPLEAELTQDVFVVSRDDGSNPSLHPDRALFSGRLIKRDNPGPDDFIKIAAGESKTAFVALADYYELKSAGSFHVSFGGEFQIEPQLNDRTILHEIEGLHAVFVETGSVLVDLTPRPEVQYARAAEYTGCTASQLAQLPGDFDESEQITREAISALENLPENERPGSPRYLRWFGTYDRNRYESVLDIYRKSEALMGRGEVEFACDCQEPFFAFIRRSEPFKVNLCTFYWSAQRSGRDSRSGTILHEVSHFNEIGGTNDFAYGHALASNLASTSPGRAVLNADSIEYFAENSPFLEISAGDAAPVLPTYVALPLNVATTGTVGQNASRLYEVAGASEIELITASGDADLYVYADAGQTDELCNSQSRTGVDSCVVNTRDTVYVSVFGFTASTFSLIAKSDATQLQLGQTQTVSIATGGLQQYTITGANFVQTNSLSGDADVYVYSSADRNSDSLVCDSRNFSAFSTLDTCEINGTGYVTVFGVRGGQYTISSFTSDPRADNPPGPVVVSQSGNSSSGGGLFGLSALLLIPFASRRRSGRSRRAGKIQ